MTKLTALFDTFLSEINPDKKYIEYAQEAHTRVRECLEEQDDKFSEDVVDTFLYGSYKRRTAVGNIKDVDVVILTNIDPNDEDNAPNKVLRRLKAALKRCYGEADHLEYQRRSIRVDDPLPDENDAELTLDIIPAVVVKDNDSPLLVPDIETEEWIKTHPKGHLKHCTACNADEYSKGRFVPLVKIMKWWWHYQCEVRQPNVERPKPKGFWIECLTGECFDPDQTSYANHFVVVLENILDNYGDFESVPELNDPSLMSSTIKTSMTPDEFSVFMTAVKETLEAARNALEEPDKVKSSQLWRDIFGEKFPLYDEEESEETRAVAKSIKLASTSHIQPLPWQEELDEKCKVRLDAYLYKGETRLAGINSNGRLISGGLNIKYVASVRLRGDYKIHWQVVNTGSEAEDAEGLRGGYFLAKLRDGSLSKNQHVNWEHTSYTGKHWIECFVVQGDLCIGRSGRFYVNIRNSAD